MSEPLNVDEVKALGLVPNHPVSACHGCVFDKNYTEPTHVQDALGGEVRCWMVPCSKADAGSDIIWLRPQ